MGWNCQNTLGSIVSYRILRESKCFTLSRFEKWVSYVPTRLLVFSGFENRKMSRNGLKLSKYVRKYRFLSHTSRSGFRMYLLFVYSLSRNLKEVGFVIAYFVEMYLQDWYFVCILDCSYSLWFENRKMSRNGLKLSKYVRKYRFLSHTSRIEMFYSFKIWEVGFVCTYWFVRILVIRKPKNVSKWVEIVKIR